MRKSRLNHIREFDFQFDRLQSNWKVVTTIVLTTLLIVLDHYQGLLPAKWMDHLVLFLVIPIFFVVVVYREPLKQYGFQWGDWKAGLVFTLGGWIIMTIIMIFVAPTADFKAYYSSSRTDLLQILSKNAFDLIGWEFIFRGLLLFALFPVCGPYAIVLQAVPFTIAHFGKPELETVSCIFGGPILGYIAWRTKSFLYPFLIHWQLTTVTILFVQLS